jgi:hypothetical protein
MFLIFRKHFMTIDISCRILENIPLEYFLITVNGSFNCCYNKLTSLTGSPRIVNGNFNCYHNKLTSLTGSLKIVNGSFNCYHNKLTSLTGSLKIVKESFYCYNNNLFNLDFLPLYFHQIISH